MQYGDHFPLFTLQAYKILNPENEARVCEMLTREPREKVEKFCTSAGFTTLKSCDCELQFAFESIAGLLKWLRSVTHGGLDLVTEDRLQKYLALYSDKKGKSLS